MENINFIPLGDDTDTENFQENTNENGINRGNGNKKSTLKEGKDYNKNDQSNKKSSHREMRGSRANEHPMDKNAKDSGPRGKNRKRKYHSGSESEDDDDLVTGDSENTGKIDTCYDGTKVPVWLAGRPRVGGPHSHVHEILNEEICRFVEYIEPTNEEHAIRGFVIEKLTRALKKLFNKGEDYEVEVVTFGSYTTGLYLPCSDLDVTVTIVDKKTKQLVINEFEGRDKKTKLLYRMKRILSKERFGRKIEVISRARVPLVKIVEEHTNISLDISINSLNGYKTAKIVKKYIDEEYPIVLKSLVLIIKFFLQQRNMNEVYTGGLGSYAIVLMLVSFLQLHPLLQTKAIDPAKNMGVLLCEFLELYGKRFNYGNVGIVLTDGGFYIERPKGEENEDPYGKKSQVLYLQDPGDMLNNVTSGTYGISRVRHSFSTAFDLLTGTMYRYFQTKRFGNPITEFEQQNKRHIFFSGNTGRNSNNVTYDLNNPVSFLSSILTVDKKTISTRGFLKNLYHQNVFQNELGLPKKLLKGNGTTNSKNNRTSSAETLHSGSFGSAGTSINKHDYKFSTGSQPDSSPVYISDSE